MKSNLSLGDYDKWLSGNEGYDKFDTVVQKFLGKKDYKKYEEKARLPQALMNKLGLYAGGISL